MPPLPMFPLGTAVLPHAAHALHVFEPRYRTLVRDVLDHDGTFGVVLIRRGSEVGGGDERFEVGTRVRVMHAEALRDGRWLLMILGLQRLRVRRWLEASPYPRADVVDVEDEHDPARVAERHAALVPRLQRVRELRLDLEGGEATAVEEPADDPAAVCWRDPAAAPLTPLDQQRLLETTSCARRLELLDELLVGVEEVLTFRLGG